MISRKHGQRPHSTKMGADKLAENTPNARKFTCSNFHPKPICLGFRWNWASIGHVFNHWSLFLLELYEFCREMSNFKFALWLWPPFSLQTVKQKQQTGPNFREAKQKKKLLKQKKNWRAAFKVACGASRVLNFSKQWRRLLMTHKIASFSAAWRTYALRTQLGTELHQPMTRARGDKLKRQSFW